MDKSRVFFFHIIKLLILAFSLTQIVTSPTHFSHFGTPSLIRDLVVYRANP